MCQFKKLVSYTSSAVKWHQKNDEIGKTVNYTNENSKGIQKIVRY
jgi:hypothetical protein